MCVCKFVHSCMAAFRGFVYVRACMRVSQMCDFIGLCERVIAGHFFFF